MASPVETSSQPDPEISPEQAASERNADFAAQLQAELEAGSAGDDDDDDPPIAAKPAKGEPAKPAPAKPSVENVSADTVLKHLRSGDLEALAKDLGADPREFKVRNSQFVKLRQQATKSRRELNQVRAQLDQEHQNLSQQRHNLQATQSKLFEAIKHLENEDWASFMEVVSGKSFDEIQRQLVQNSLDPSAKEIRKLRAEQAERDRKDQEREQQRQQEQARAQQAQAQAQYMRQLQTELFEDEDLGLAEFQDHPNMPRFLQAVFAEQQKSFDGENVISAKKAAQRAIKLLLAEHSSWQPFTAKYGSGSTTPKSTEQGARTTSKSARGKSVARSQGGSLADVKKMDHQQFIGHFADQMRSEFR